MPFADEIASPREIALDPADLPLLLPLLQQGVQIEIENDCSLEDLLCRQWGLERDYVLGRISTLFLDGRPVDDIETARVTDGARLAQESAGPDRGHHAAGRGAGLVSKFDFPPGKPDSRIPRTTGADHRQAVQYADPRTRPRSFGAGCHRAPFGNRHAAAPLPGVKRHQRCVCRSAHANRKMTAGRIDACVRKPRPTRNRLTAPGVFLYCHFNQLS